MSWQAPGYAHRLDLGGGKTGRAFLAANEDSGELVVIKYLSVETTRVEQVRAELSELSMLDSRSFVTIREVIASDDGVAVVMDPINGASLRALLRDGGALPAEASLLIFHETLTTLAAAHAAGIAHGDYRPENVMVDLTGATVLLDARAAGWVDRDISLGTGVYLAPERWHAGALTAEADVYAATVTFVEMLVGEPPYWEDSQLLALRYRHEQAEIPVEGIPVPLRETVRLGMAKDTEVRADAGALLAVVDVIAIAEYGPDWAEAGRAALATLVSERQLAFGGIDTIEDAPVVAAGELVELDDYYLESDEAVAVAEVDEAESVAAESVAVESLAGEAVEAEADAGAEVTEAAVAAEVVAAAAEIVELASIETMAVGDISTEEDVLTEEEERAVAEVEGLVADVEESVAVGTVAVEGMDIAATEAELVEIDQTLAEGAAVEGAVFESEFAEGAFAEGTVAEGLIAEGAAAEGVVAGELVEEGLTGEQRSVATGVAKVGPPPIAVGVATVPFRRRHPWLTGTIAIFIVIIVAGVALGLTGGLAGGPSAPSTPRAAITETATAGGVIPPASTTPTPANGPSTPAASAPPAPGPSTTSPASPKAPATHKPKPSPTPTKLPVTGSSTGYTFGLAGLLLAVGTLLVIVARRRRA